MPKSIKECELWFRLPGALQFGICNIAIRLPSDWHIILDEVRSAQAENANFQLNVKCQLYLLGTTAGLKKNYLIYLEGEILKKISPPKFLDVCAFFEVTNVLEKCLPFYFQQDIACFTISIYMHKKVEIAKSEKGENKNKSILENLNTCFGL